MESINDYIERKIREENSFEIPEELMDLKDEDGNPVTIRVVGDKLMISSSKVMNGEERIEPIGLNEVTFKVATSLADKIREEDGND